MWSVQAVWPCRTTLELLMYEITRIVEHEAGQHKQGQAVKSDGKGESHA